MIVSTRQFLKDSIRALPSRARFWDGKARAARYDIQRLFNEWRGNSDLRAEADNAFNAYTGGDFIDVGASVGFYAALLAPKARSGDRFVLCEPDSRAHPRLFANLSSVAYEFPHISISVLAAPLGDGGVCAAATPGDSPAAHFRYGDANADTAITMTSTSLDSLVHTLTLKPRLVKIDVEGAEFNVLRGMADTLERHRPAIAIEVHPSWLPAGVTSDTISSVLSGAGYMMRSTAPTASHSRQLWT